MGNTTKGFKLDEWCNKRHPEKKGHDHSHSHDNGLNNSHLSDTTKISNTHALSSVRRHLNLS